MTAKWMVASVLQTSIPEITDLHKIMKLLRFLLLLFAMFAGFVTSTEAIGLENPVLTLSTGKIRGTTIVTSQNRTGVAYLGVPFGEAPVGDLRWVKFGSEGVL